MMILLILVALLVLALLARPAVRWIRLYRMTSELHGDWWSRFERDLHEYMSQSWRSAREAERQR